MPDFDDLQERMATSMDASPELLPFLPELFADLEELGSTSHDVIALLHQLPTAAEPRLLDLGCGKGAVALAIAKDMPCQVTGIDGMEPFVMHARQLAAERELADRCLFRVGDVRQAVRNERGWDVVMLLALGDVFGAIDQTIAALRPCVAPGGYLIIDDAWFDPSRVIPDEHDLHEGLDNLHDRDTTRALIESHGDRIVLERTIDEPQARPIYEAMTKKILARAQALAARLEDRSASRRILEFAERQHDEVELLCGPVVGALWAVQVHSPGSTRTEC